ncbi:hypothetical protein FHW67_002655 [Herbaspirillum sp. Sphag1AN]|nr:hypothetical protein [Herbaspirillum sp. Sphag1AN]MBB3246593.1 hypothetical protein [Herbaspirillum sp. Sphag64]
MPELIAMRVPARHKGHPHLKKNLNKTIKINLINYLKIYQKQKAVPYALLMYVSFSLPCYI